MQATQLPLNSNVQVVQFMFPPPAVSMPPVALKILTTCLSQANVAVQMFVLFAHLIFYCIMHGLRNKADSGVSTAMFSTLCSMGFRASG